MSMTSTDALLGARACVQGFCCIGWIGNTPIVGTADGNLYRFIGRQLDGIIRAHNGPVHSIASHSNGIYTCGSDGEIKCWARLLECLHTVSIKDLISYSLDIRCLDCSEDGQKLLFGTSAGDIYEVAADGRNIHRYPIHVH